MFRSRFWHNSQAGAFAAVAVDLLVYPLDTLKTRFQSPDYKKIYYDASKKAINRGLLFRGLYQGVGPVILVTIPSCMGSWYLEFTAILMFHSRSILHHIWGNKICSHQGKYKLRWQQHATDTPTFCAQRSFGSGWTCIMLYTDSCGGIETKCPDDPPASPLLEVWGFCYYAGIEAIQKTFAIVHRIHGIGCPQSAVHRNAIPYVWARERVD